MARIEGPVGFYARWPGEEPRLTLAEHALQALGSFCKLVWEDETRKERCLQGCEGQAIVCAEPQVSVCWLGVHNAICPVMDEYGNDVTLIDGGFHVRERQDEAEKRLEKFLETISFERRETFREAWRQIPEISEKEVLGYRLRELELVGRGYLCALRQRKDFRDAVGLMTHDAFKALQPLVAGIDLLKIELKDTYCIGRAWQDQFEALVRMCKEHEVYLEAIFDLHKPEYAYKSIDELIRECADSCLSKAKSREIGFQVDLEREVGEGSHKIPPVCMDRITLRQALLNVLDNAVECSFPGTVDHPQWIKIIGRLETVGRVPGYSIVVSNLGIGIEEDELDLVFEPGFQGRQRLDKPRSSYGMGLARVKKCVEQHGGDVAIDSQPQQQTGWLTTLSIWLPLSGPTARHSREA